jgi:hypothetical protein
MEKNCIYISDKITQILCVLNKEWYCDFKKINNNASCTCNKKIIEGHIVYDRYESDRRNT